MVGIESARAREQPDPGAREQLLLPAQRGKRALERRAIRADSKEGNPLRGIAVKLPLELRRTRDQFFRTEFGRHRCRAWDQVGQAETELEKLLVLPRRIQAPGESAGVERGPEPVPWPREMVPRPGGVQPRIDPAKDDRQSRPQGVPNRAVRGREQVRPSWSRPVASSTICRQPAPRGRRQNDRCSRTAIPADEGTAGTHCPRSSGRDRCRTGSAHRGLSA